jgi:transcription elongation factor S-II
MDAKEIEQKGKAIVKAAAGGDPPSVIQGLIGELSTGVKATEEILRSTKIGVTVNKMRSHKDPAVQKDAAALVSKWRLDVKRNVSSGASTPKLQQNGMSSPAAASQSPAPAKAKSKHTVSIDKRNAAADKVDTNLTANKIRDNCLKLMYDGLAFMSEECTYIKLVFTTHLVPSR